MKASEIKNFDLSKERETFACLIAFYVGNLSEGWLDNLKIMTECVDIANSYDFECEKIDDNYYISTELAYEAAEKYASKIVEREKYYAEHKENPKED